MLHKKKLVIITLLAVILIGSCSKDVMIETIIPFIGFRKPDHFPQPEYQLDRNPVTEAGFKLGKRLFYEPRLSRDNTVSCGSCHIQASGFTHHGHDISHGIDDRLGKRNSPPVMNLAWHKFFNWDGGVFDLDLQPIVPITTHEEMDENMDNVLAKLRNHEAYPELFEKAFGSSEINSQRMLQALSQFMVMCVSSHSKYDSVVHYGTAHFTEQEQAGYLTFQAKCASCHKEPMFSDFSFRNNGIGIGFNGDPGRYEITLNEADKYKFKVPSLRNLKYTKPYMHDGRFYTLEAVLDHYSDRMQMMDNLEPELIRDGIAGIPLTRTEKENLIRFLNTLNDEQFVRNPLLSE